MDFSLSFTIEVEGRDYKFMLDMNSICEFETYRGINLFTGGPEAWNNFGFNEYRILAWSMLYRESPRPDLFEAGDIISKVGFYNFMEKFVGLVKRDSEGRLVNDDGEDDKETPDPTRDYPSEVGG